MTPAERKALRELAEKATRGPWKADVGIRSIGSEVYEPTVTTFGGSRWIASLPSAEDARVQSNADAAYIAAASPDVTTALLDALEKAEEESVNLREIAKQLAATLKASYEARETSDKQALVELTLLRADLAAARLALKS